VVYSVGRRLKLVRPNVRNWRLDLRGQWPAARILIADDHRLLADACKSMLEPEFSVIATVTDGCDIAPAVDALKRDIVLSDIYMPNLNGLDAGE
jgi:CheY-like chemotaxis protein